MDMNLPRSHTSIFRSILDFYGRAALLEARQWEKLAGRITDNYRKISFLHSCLRNHLVPKSLRRKPVVATFEGYRALHRFQVQSIKAIINDLHRKINRLKERVAAHRARSLSTLTSQHYAALHQHIDYTIAAINSRAANRLANKTQRLRTDEPGVPDDRLIHNISDKTLSRSQVALLRHDAGHNIYDASNLDFVASLEASMHRINPEAQVRDAVRIQVVNLLMGHKKPQILPRCEAEALKQLKEDPSIVILPADKGRATVIMNRPSYIDKALELLEDSSAYRVVPQDPSTTLINSTNKVLSALKRKGRLSDDILKRIRPGDLALARFYGLPKIHKVGVPLRPIVSFRNTPTSGLAKWLSNRINYLVQGSSTTVKSAEEFVSRLTGLRVEEDETMVSFDVVSLFTSIPQELAIDTIRDLLLNTDSEQHGDKLRPEDLVDLLKLCLTVYFTFQGVIYEQIKGTPMGSPISSVIAEAVLQRVERVAMTQLCPKFWVRYVDDTFVVIKKSQQTPFITILNSVCADIQFTMEDERQGKLAFLDVLVHRQEDGTLHTKVYRKPTHTDRILHFCSNHPMAHKVGCIRTLFKRVNSHCSTTAAKAEERRHLFRTFRQNGYPMGIIKRFCTTRGPPRHPITQDQFETHTQLSQFTRISLPYIHNVSEATARILAPLNVRVAHKPSHTLRSIVMRPKDPLPTLEKSGVIYNISCRDCPRSYVGETSKRIKTRVREHQLAIKRGESYSQLWAHMMETGHSFDFVDVGVLAISNSKGGRLLKEAWLSGEESLNRHIELHQAYVALKAWEKRLQPPRLMEGHLSIPSLPPDGAVPSNGILEVSNERELSSPQQRNGFPSDLHHSKSPNKLPPLTLISEQPDCDPTDYSLPSCPRRTPLISAPLPLNSNINEKPLWTGPSDNTSNDIGTTTAPVTNATSEPILWESRRITRAMLKTSCVCDLKVARHRKQHTPITSTPAAFPPSSPCNISSDQQLGILQSGEKLVTKQRISPVPAARRKIRPHTRHCKVAGSVVSPTNIDETAAEGHLQERQTRSEAWTPDCEALLPTTECFRKACKLHIPKGKLTKKRRGGERRELKDMSPDPPISTECPCSLDIPPIQERGAIKGRRVDDLSLTPLAPMDSFKRDKPEDFSPTPYLPDAQLKTVRTHTPTEGIKTNTKGKGRSPKSKGKGEGMRAALPLPQKTPLNAPSCDDKRDLTTEYTLRYASSRCISANAPVGVGLQTSRSKLTSKGQDNICRVIDSKTHREPIGCTRPRTRAWCRLHPNSDA